MSDPLAAQDPRWRTQLLYICLEDGSYRSVEPGPLHPEIVEPILEPIERLWDPREPYDPTDCAVKTKRYRLMKFAVPADQCPQPDSDLAAIWAQQRSIPRARRSAPAANEVYNQGWMRYPLHN